jgi:hypothetical protein
MRTVRLHPLAVILALSLCDPTGADVPTTAPATQAAALGSAENPVRCDGPRGERAYLSRLRDAAGKSPSFFREGSFGRGPHGHIVDRYEVTASDGTKSHVYMDMYFPNYEEAEPVPGFNIVPAPGGV